MAPSCCSIRSRTTAPPASRSPRCGATRWRRCWRTPSARRRTAGCVAQASGAAGNPSLLTELMRCLREENTVEVTDGSARLISAQLPRRIDLVARQGLDGLSGPARHLLETGAVQGRSFRLDEAAEMLGVTPAALLPAVEEAVDAGILVTSEDLFRFRRKLVWHAVVHMIPRPARRALHRQFGEILLSRGGSAAQAARHLLRAAHANDPASLTGLDKAAAETLETSPQTAARLAQRAVELTDPADPGALPRAVAAAEALTAAGQLEQAARIIHDTLPQPLPLVLEARLRCALSSIRCASGLPQHASDRGRDRAGADSAAQRAAGPGDDRAPAGAGRTAQPPGRGSRRGRHPRRPGASTRTGSSPPRWSSARWPAGTRAGSRMDWSTCARRPATTPWPPRCPPVPAAPGPGGRAGRPAPLR